MLSWLSAQLFFAEHQRIKKNYKSPQEVSEPVWVHLWETSANGVGHAAIQVGGDSPKRSEADPGRYMSLWPALLPTQGIFSFIPGPAEVATTLDDDMRMEEILSKAPLLVTDFSSPPFLPCLSPSNDPSDDNDYKSPTYSIKITGLDTRAMLIEMDKQELLIHEGKTLYQLFSQFQPLSIAVSDGPAIISHDTSESFVHFFKNPIENRLPLAFNCTMFVAHLLTVGGLKNIIPNSWQPWGLTPLQLGTKIKAEVELNTDESFLFTKK